MANLTPIKQLAAKVGEYREGNTVKGRYFNIGTLFTKDDGSLVIKLDGVPVGPDFKGWVYAFDIKEKKGAETAVDPADDMPFEH